MGLKALVVFISSKAAKCVWSSEGMADGPSHFVFSQTVNTLCCDPGCSWAHRCPRGLSPC